MSELKALYRLRALVIGEDWEEIKAAIDEEIAALTQPSLKHIWEFNKHWNEVIVEALTDIDSYASIPTIKEKISQSYPSIDLSRSSLSATLSLLHDAKKVFRKRGYGGWHYSLKENDTNSSN